MADRQTDATGSEPIGPQPSTGRQGGMRPLMRMRFHPNPYLWVVAGALLIVLIRSVILMIFPPGWMSPVELEIEVRVDPHGRAKWKDDFFLQVFQDTGRGMNEEQSRHLPVMDTGRYERVKIVLPYRKWERIRFDGPPLPGLFSLRSLHLVSDEATLSWRGEELREVLVPTVQVVEVGKDPMGGLVYRATGGDPQFSLEVDFPQPQIWGWSSFGRMIFPLGATFCALVLSGWGLVYLSTVWREIAATRQATVLLGVGIVLIFVLYASFATQAEKKPVPQHMAGHNLYFHLTDAFLHGQVFLLEEPARPLREMDNPFDPLANQRLRLHDASYYRGRYYVYFGAAPVVALYVPWKVLTGSDLPDRWADAFFLFGTFLLLFFTFLRAGSLFPRRIDRGPVIVGFLSIGLTTGALFLLSRSVVYEVALASAAFWMSAALFLAFEGVKNGRFRRRHLLLAGGFMGLAMGSRHSFVVPCVIFAAVTSLYFLVKIRPLSSSVRNILALNLPAALVGVVLLYHNHVRFDDYLEFGHNHQIGVVDPHEVDFFDPGNAPFNSMISLFQPPDFGPSFPWVRLRGQKVLGWVDPSESYIEMESGIGLFVANPYLLLFPFLLPAVWRKSGRPGWIWLVTAVTGIAAANFLVIAFFSYYCARYAFDYVPWVVLLFAMFWWLASEEREEGGKWRIIHVFLVFGLIWSIGLHFGLAFDRLH